MAEAFAAGRIGVDSVAAIVSGLVQASSGCDATPENLDAAEAALVEAAVVLPADDVAAQARLWRDAMDPDGVEPRYEEICERRLMTIGRERNGVTPIRINAAPTLAATSANNLTVVATQ